MKSPRSLPLPLGRARAALLWERMWSRALPPILIVGLFLATALADLLPHLPWWLHGIVLAAFAAALVGALVRAARGFAAVSEAEARRRIEADNLLDHRPLTALADQIAAGGDDPTAVALWQAHLRRMVALARNLKVGMPSPGVPRRDPWALRALVLLALVVAAVAGRGDAVGRLERALTLRLASAAAAPLTIELWLTPPDYTRRAPIFLRPEAVPSPGPLQVPQGSAVLAQVSGIERAPRLHIGATETVFTRIGSAAQGVTHRVQATVNDGDRLAVVAGGREFASWPIEVVPDRVPEITFAKPPEATARHQLRIEYQARDDYGVVTVGAEIRRGDAAAGIGGVDPLALDIPLPRPGATTARGYALRDLTAHPWAGLPVVLRLVATDARGQKGTSEEVATVLPERTFTHPVARAIIAERKKLALPTPPVRTEVAASLALIKAMPERFANDTVVFLALSVAQHRLMLDERTNAIDSVQRLMWDTALRIEEGETSVVERELTALQERLMRALQDGTDSAEVERLMNELQRTMDNYLQALMEQMMRQGAVMDLPALPNMEMIGRDDLQRMIERARDLARMGNLDAARQMLAELQRMLDNLRAGVRPGPNTNQAMSQAQNSMNQMRDLIQRQQRLMDRTFRRSQGQRGEIDQRRQRGERGQPGSEGQPGDDPEAEADAAEQEALRRALGDLMVTMDEILGQIPPSFGKAERAMRDAFGAMRDAQPGQAVPHQREALEQLRQGAQSAGEQMARQMGGMMRLGIGQPAPMGGQRDPRERDPFGRTPDGHFGTAVDGDVKVPDEMEMRRAREILDELHRRANQTRRPKLEREYIDRLLRRF